MIPAFIEHFSVFRYDKTGMGFASIMNMIGYPQEAPKLFGVYCGFFC